MDQHLLKREPMSRSIAITALLAVATVPASAAAYNPIEVHRWIARQAVAHLDATYPGQYEEARAYVEAIASGAEHEDDGFLDGDTDPTTVRLMRHFYRPVDLAGLSVEPFGSFPNSYEWGGTPNLQNEWGWDDAYARYAEGDIEAAYFAIGHVVHLVSDLTVPAHVHLDEHGPPYGDDYEGYCTNMTQNQFESMLPLPPAGTPVTDYADIRELWQATAMASYWRNMYPGQLAEIDAPAGVLADMFGDALSYNYLAETWKIDGVGNLGSAFVEEEPGVYYFSKLTGTPAMDRVGFDPHDATSMAFGNAGDGPMVERIADDMIPLAILSSAAAIKLFIDSKPTVDESDDEDPVDPAEASGCNSTGSNGSPLGLLVFLSLAFFFRFRRN